MQVLLVRLTAVSMFFSFQFDRDNDQPSVPYAALRNNVIGEVLHLRCLSPEHRDFHAARMVEMDVHRCERQIVVVVERLG